MVYSEYSGVNINSKRFPRLFAYWNVCHIDVAWWARYHIEILSLCCCAVKRVIMWRNGSNLSTIVIIRHKFHMHLPEFDLKLVSYWKIWVSKKILLISILWLPPLNVWVSQIFWQVISRILPISPYLITISAFRILCMPSALFAPYELTRH